ncbi:unnamed protein product [Nippostrongylus brasiliensis]|uniref:ALOG domain-containing protein n=1 Tax=Nippostrongylus brasiliensis TaxID=27835 RepID=A0A0N4YHT1_NIPBR|nr:unnamed protein product [Nippostrongylus brasiliensis]
MSDDAIEREVEELMLLDGDDSALAGLQAQVAGLTEQVRQLTDSNAPQDDGSGLTEDVQSTVDSACNAIETEIAQLQRLSKQIGGLRRFDLDQLMELMAEGLQQARHDDACMRILAKLLRVNSTEVVAALKTLLRKGRRSTLDVEIPRAEETEAETPNTDVLQGNVNLPCSSRVQQVAIGVPDKDPLHLFYPCTCGIFNERAHVGLPGLRCNLARSKKVRNLFELANVASIALEPAWGEHRKEAELLKKQSTHLTVIGLSCAISAHRQFCHDFAIAVKENEGKRLFHPAIFSHYPGYDISAYYAQAMARREQITEFYSDDMPTNSIVLALPKSFGRVLTDVEPEATVKFVVYNHLGDMADQLNKLSITAAMVWVWPESMPNSVHMRDCLQAIERHLQCGGTLDCFPVPFEKNRSDTWEELRRVCIEVVQMLTGPKRGFDARVIDHYGPLAEDVPKMHPAVSLGVNPRKCDERYHPWQVRIFLKQLRHTASNTLRLPEIKLKERKPKDAKDEPSTSATDSNKGHEPPTKKRKMPKRPEISGGKVTCLTMAVAYKANVDIL